MYVSADASLGATGATMACTMSMHRSPKVISRLSSILAVGPVALFALSACTVAYTPPPSAGPPPAVSGHPDMTGWRLMGDAQVGGQFERAIVRVGKPEGRVARLMLVVMDSNLEVGDVVIQFGNGQRWSPGLRHEFADGSRSRAIELPGHVRFIRGVELVHGAAPPGRRARVEIWGQ
jgi:hypothetical protein